MKKDEHLAKVLTIVRNSVAEKPSPDPWMLIKALERIHDQATASTMVGNKRVIEIRRIAKEALENCDRTT